MVMVKGWEKKAGVENVNAKISIERQKEISPRTRCLTRGRLTNKIGINSCGEDLLLVSKEVYMTVKLDYSFCSRHPSGD